MRAPARTGSRPRGDRPAGPARRAAAPPPPPATPPPWPPARAGHEPADDQAGDQEDAEREGDAVPRKADPAAEVVHAPPFREDEKRDEDHRQRDRAEHAVTERPLHDNEDQRPACRAAVLVRVERRV